MKRAFGLLAVGIASVMPLMALEAPVSAAPNVSAAPTLSVESSAQFSGDPRAEIVSVGEPLLTEGQDLSVSVSISNPSSTDFTITESRLRAQYRTSTMRSRILDFMAGDDVPLYTMQVLNDPLVVKAGETATVNFTVPWNELGWEYSSAQWGPRGVETVMTLADGTKLTDRSIVVVAPHDELTPMPTTVVVPLTLTAQELGNEPTLAEVLQKTFGGSTEPSTTGLLTHTKGVGRLTDSLEELSINGVTAVLEPSVLTQESARIAANAFAGTAGTELLFTPLFDADAHGLVANGHTQTLVDAYASGSALATEAGLTPPAHIALLTPSTDQHTVSALVDSGIDGVVVPGNEVTTTGYRYYTASGRTDLDVSTSAGDTVPALATDTTASAALAGILAPDADIADPSEDPTHLSALDSRQTVLALSAITYRERPNDSRATILAVDRDGIPYYGTSTMSSATKDDPLYTSNISATISALMDAPWVEPSTASAILQGDAVSDERDSLPEEADAPTAIGGQDIATIQDSVGLIDVVAGLSPAPAIVQQPTQVVASQLYSTAWRSNTSIRSNRIRSLNDTANYFTSSLEVMPSSTIRVVSQQTELPVHVTNTLPFDVGIALQLDSHDARLRAEKPVAVTIPANSSTRIMVPIKANGSGNIKIDAVITSPSGAQIGARQVMEIRVRADWENIGTLIMAIVVASVLAFGIVRSLRKGRRSAPLAPALYTRERREKLRSKE